MDKLFRRLECVWDGRGLGLRIGECSPARRDARGSLEESSRLWALPHLTRYSARTGLCCPRLAITFAALYTEIISLAFSTVLPSNHLYVSCGHLKVFGTSQRYRYDLPVFIIAPRTCSSLRFTILTTTSQGPIALNNLCKGFDRIGKST